MSTDLLFERFTTLATAPEGIAQLRNLILDLAFSGRLGTQDANDEFAKKMIETSLHKEFQYISEDESHILPKSWIQLPLIDVLSSIESGSRPIGGVREIKSGIPSIGGEHLDGRGGFRFGTIKFVSPEFYQKMTKGKIRTGDLLIVKDGATTGKVSLVDSRFPFSEACINEHVFICRFYDFITPQFAFYYLYSEIGQTRILENFKGAAQGGINLSFANNTLIPIAPLAEQHRIIAKIKALMALCDEIEFQQLQERAVSLRLGTASLIALQSSESPEEFERQWAQVCDAFELIFDCPENARMLRETILQMAIQGRLILKPKDEGSSIPLVSFVKEDSTDIGYRLNIPQSWQWDNINGVCETIVDCPHSTPKWTQNGEICLRTTNFKPGYLDLTEVRYVSHDTYLERISRLEPRENDILFSREGGILGIACMIPKGLKTCLGQRMMLLRVNPKKAIPKYILILLNSPFVQMKVKEQTGGTSSPHLNVGDVKNFQVPLPPLAEQHRIVAKVDALMALCDALESCLKERAGVQSKFATAVVKQIGSM